MDQEGEGTSKSRIELIVAAVDDGCRLDRYLAAQVTGLSRMWLRQAIDQGRVTTEGSVRPAGSRVREGERISLEVPPGTATGMSPEPIPIAVLFEDDWIAVVEKPAGIVVHPAGRHRDGTLVNALAHHFNVVGRASPPVRPGLVHRLDRSTSGLMVIAKTQVALSRLTVDFQNKTVEKRYLALVHGAVGPEAGDWHAPIGSDPEARPRWGVREGGRPAHTRYRVRERLSERTLLELEPVTGRTNQLRLHAAHFGHPIAGDDLFGRGLEPGLDRLFLHAYRLAFRHPGTGQPLEFELELPEDLAALLRVSPASRETSACPRSAR